MAAAAQLCRRLLCPLYTRTKTTLLTGVVSKRAVTTSSFRLIHTSTLCGAGQRFRESRGLARSGNEYGPLTDLPDWSDLDGTPAPPSTRRLKRDAKRKAISTRIRRLMKQVDEAQLKEVYDGLGMPYEPESGSKAETAQKDEGLENTSGQEDTAQKDVDLESNSDQADTSSKTE